MDEPSAKPHARKSLNTSRTRCSKPPLQEGTGSEGFANHAFPTVREPLVGMLSGPKMLRNAHSATDARIPINTLLVIVSIKLSTMDVDSG